MARIQTYTVDTEIQGDDLLVGTDSQTGMPTRNFKVSDLKTFIGEGEDIRESVGANYVPVVGEDGETVENSSISQEIATGGSGAQEFSGASNESNFVLARVVYQSPDAVLEVYDWKQPYYIGSLVGRTFTITAGGQTFSGTVRNQIDPEGLPDSIPTDSEITDAEPVSQEIGGVVRRVDRFVITLSGGDIPDANELVSSMTIGAGLRAINFNIAGTLDSGSQDITGNLNVSGNATVQGNTLLGSGGDTDTLTVNATSQFDGDVTIGSFGDTDPLINPDHTLTVHGDVVIPSTEGSVTIGSGDERFSISVLDTSTTQITQSGADGVLNIDGNKTLRGGTAFAEVTRHISSVSGSSETDNVTINNQLVRVHDIQDDEILVGRNPGRGNNYDVQLTRDGEIVTRLRRVTGNNRTEEELDGEDFTANLQSITVGNSTFNLPELSAGVAEALPGLTEELSGAIPPQGQEALFAGQFFYGLEQSFGASNIPTTGAGQPETLGGISGASGIILQEDQTTLDLSGITDAQRRAFETLRTGRTAGDFMLFFVGSTFNIPSGTTQVSIGDTDVYEIISYNADEMVAVFGRVGGGTLQLQSERIEIGSSEVIYSNLPADVYDSSSHRFLTVRNNDESGQVATAELNIQGTANGARVTQVDGQPADIGVSSLEFTGNQNNVESDANGNVSVDLSGRYQIIGTQTSATDLVAYTIPQADLFGVITLDVLPANPSGMATTDAVAVIGAEDISVADASGIASGSTFMIGANTYTIEGVDTMANEISISPPVMGASIASGTPINWSRSYAGIVQLPSAAPGDSIKVLNTSTFTATGTQTSGTWRITGNAAQSIMKASSGLILDDQTASFEMIYVDDTVGWGIFGIN